MKKFRKLIPALALLLVSAVLMSTASYAWFSMNNKVTVTGMEVKTKVSSNLLVADGGDVDSNTLAAEEAFKTALTQTRKGILEPVSTVDGTTFHYTVQAAADGKKIGSDAYLKYTSGASPVGSNAASYTDRFSEVYGVTTSNATGMDFAGAVPYVDYVIQLKAGNTDSTSKVLKLTQLDLEYDNADAETDTVQKAFRVAVFVEKVTGRNNFTAGDVGTLVAIYAVDGAENWTAGKAINASGALADVGPATTLNIDNSLTGNSTAYYKVVVRLYIEGEDQTCNNSTFMTLLGQWKLNLAFELDTATPAVTVVTKTAA